MMRHFLALCVLIFVFSVVAFAQVRILSAEKSASSFSCTFVPNEDEYGISTDDTYTTITYPGYLDAAEPGKPALPSKTVLVAIPPHATVRVWLGNIETIVHEKTIPASSPQTVLENDSTLVYKKAAFDTQYFTTDIYPAHPFEILDYRWIRNYYRASQS